VADDPALRDTPTDVRRSDQELAQLREILVGREQKELARLRARIDQVGFTPERLADELPEAIFRRTDRGDRQLAIALAPSVEKALAESVRKHPTAIASAIFPVLGPAIRKAIGEALAGLVASVNAGIGQSLSLRGLQWRFEAWRTGVPYAQVVIRHSLLYRVEQVLLIHAETGLLLAHVSSPDLTATDGDLISGMLTAIRDFVGDSFAQEREVGGLTSFKVGELGVIVEPGPQAILAAVVRGPVPESLKDKLRETIESIHLRFADPLAGFSGDATPFAPARELLSDCLETVLHTDRSRQRGVSWWPWMLALLVLASLLGVLLYRRAASWQRAIARLESEPGIVLVRAEQGWRRSRLSGLRDPLAAAPAAVLAAVGTDTTRIDGRWQPYISLDSSMVVARARRHLDVPASVTLQLDADTLRVRGAAPMSWVASTGALRVKPPGIASVDLDRVEVQLAPALAAELALVEQRRVLFAVASSRLSPLAVVTIDSTAQQLTAVNAALDAVGQQLEVELAGRADPTGMDSTNQSLSADRAAVVRAALVRAGVPETSLSTQALGSTSLLSADDPTVRARLNRSVSFVVRVVRRQRATTPDR
jgi:outer membrane protein OmpA-like peptidoglycan-associated protein